MIEHLRLWLGYVPGQMMGLGMMLAVSLAVTVPVCLVWGALYAMLARGTGAQVSGVESLGFAVGGFLLWALWVSPFGHVNPALRAAQWSGYDVVQKIENTKTLPGDRPAIDQKIIKAYVKKGNV